MSQTSTIPISTIIDVTPGVLSAGGTAIQMIGLMLDSSTRVPIGTVLSFPNLTSIGTYWGETSLEYAEGEVYFGGFEIGTQTPAALLVAQYPTASVAAWLRGGNISALTLTQLQALNGTLDVTINGTVEASSSISLSSAVSFSSAAQLIDAGLSVAGPVQATVTASLGATFTGTAGSPNTLMVAASVTGTISAGDTLSGTGCPTGVVVLAQTSGTIGGAGTYSMSGTITSSSNAIVDTSSTLYITHVASGTIQPGQLLVGVNVSSGTYITTGGTGTGHAGSYVITSPQEVISEAMTLQAPTVTYDTLAGAFTIASPTTGAASTIGFGSSPASFATNLALTQAAGAVASQGATAAVPATFMTALTNITEDWATFWTDFDPDAGSGNTQKQAFAAWNNAQGNSYLYAATDTDITPTESPAATSSLGYILGQNNTSGTAPLYKPVGSTVHLGAFWAGFVASLNWNQTNGRANIAFMSQTGLGETVNTAAAAANLIANGYSYYGQYSDRAEGFTFAYPGNVSGPFQWLDSYVNQIYFNSQIQQALISGRTQVGNIPYNPFGYGLIRSFMQDPINQAINFGTIRQGVTLSSAQQAIVSEAVGTQNGAGAVSALQTIGWYLFIGAATPQVRQARQSPPIILYYTDGQNIQSIQLASILVQ